MSTRAVLLLCCFLLACLQALAYTNLEIAVRSIRSKKAAFLREQPITPLYQQPTHQGPIKFHPSARTSLPKGFQYRPSLTRAETSPAELVVQTLHGPVKGFVETRNLSSGSISCRAFWGIRYAAPPTGNNRWLDPQPPATLTETFDATRFGPGCPQDCTLPQYACPNTTSEDCLFLNVWTPLNVNTSALLPVMVWIHGGRFLAGSGEGPLFDAAAMVSGGQCVVVTLNYRLGALGYMLVPGGAGNYGLQDQIKALEWVQSNIATFGGNSLQVTVFGQSSGATSIASMMVSPSIMSRVPSLFHAAILESNPWSVPLQNNKTAHELASRFARETNCEQRGDINMTCLRQLDPSTVVTAQKAINVYDIFSGFSLLRIFYPWTPLIGSTVPDEPLRLFLNGSAAKIPIVLGSTAEESRGYIYSALQGDVATGATAYLAALAVTFGVFNVDEIIEWYPFDNFADNRPVEEQLMTDFVFGCPARAVARTHSANNHSYLYYFNHSFAFVGAWDTVSDCEGHACHGVELPFVFNNTQGPLFPFTPDEMALGAAVSGSWIHFASQFNVQRPTWNPYDQNADNTYIWRTPVANSTERANPRQSFCVFWDHQGYFASLNEKQ